jgi:hypothetical protein
MAPRRRPCVVYVLGYTAKIAFQKMLSAGCISAYARVLMAAVNQGTAKLDLRATGIFLEPELDGTRMR